MCKSILDSFCEKSEMIEMCLSGIHDEVRSDIEFIHQLPLIENMNKLKEKIMWDAAENCQYWDMFMITPIIIINNFLDYDFITYKMQKEELTEEQLIDVEDKYNLLDEHEGLGDHTFLKCTTKNREIQDKLIMILEECHSAENREFRIADRYSDTEFVFIGYFEWLDWKDWEVLTNDFIELAEPNKAVEFIIRCCNNS